VSAPPDSRGAKRSGDFLGGWPFINVEQLRRGQKGRGKMNPLMFEIAKAKIADMQREAAADRLARSLAPESRTRKIIREANRSLRVAVAFILKAISH
jgi:hypothetical protein